MKDIEPITVSQYLDLLRAKRSGVPLDLAGMAGPHEAYAAFRARLSADDLDRLYLWFQFRKYTGGSDSKLTDVTGAADQVDRVRRFIDGDPGANLTPADLRTSPGLEPMLVGEGLHCGPLYVIDGNHRMIAQFRTGRSFEDIPVCILAHPRLMEWEYAHDVVRNWRGLVYGRTAGGR